MVAINFTNLVSGGFETNITGHSGFSTNNQNVEASLTPTQQTLPASPRHSESGTKVLQIGAKTQGLVYTNPTSPILTTIGKKYYIKAMIKNRGISVAGTASVGTIVNGTSVPQKSTVAPVPLSEGLQTTNITDWVLIDSIWTSNSTTLIPRTVFQTTANSGNNDIYGCIDNLNVIDLTTPCGAGNEPPLLAMREAVQKATPNNGLLEGSALLDVPPAPIISTSVIAEALFGRSYNEQISIQAGSGSAPFSFALSGLPLGHGLSINSSGQITGVCNLPEGQYGLIVTVTDRVGYNIYKSFDLDVWEPPIILDNYIPGAILNEPYLFTPTVIGSSDGMDISITVTGGSLPTGLSIIGLNIIGTALVDRQTCQITINAVNDCDPIGVSKTFTLGVYSAPYINTPEILPHGTLNGYYSCQLISSGITPIEYEFVSGTLPPGTNIDENGLISGIITSKGTYSFSVKAVNSLGEDIKLFFLSVYELPVIITTTLGYARLNNVYSAQLLASGDGTITFSMVGGSLPTGLSLSPNGFITGTTLSVGTYTITVVASNLVGNSNPVVLTINAGLALGIVTTSPLPSGIVGVAYTPIVFKAEGIDASYTYAFTWAAQAGSSLPPGMTLNTTAVAAGGVQTTQGQLSGTCTIPGTYRFNVTVTNGTITSTSPFTLTIGAPPNITSPSSFGGGIDRPFSTYLTTDSATTVTWTLPSGPTPSTLGGLPVVISITPDGKLSWLAQEIGVVTFTVVATNVYGSSAPMTITLTITTPSIIDSPTLESEGIVLVVGDYISYTFRAGGEIPFEWFFMSGNLPTGTSFNAATATMFGILETAGVFNFVLRVSNISGSVQEHFTLTVKERPLITTQSLPAGNVNTAYSQALSTSGTTPITLSLVTPSGSETGPPVGFSLNGNTISGTTSTPGTYTFSVKAINELGEPYAHIKQYSLFIALIGAPIITSYYELIAIKGIPFSKVLEVNGYTPITWTLESGNLASGIQLNNPSSGVISGTSNIPGTYNFTLKATNSIDSDTKQFVLKVLDPPTITSLSLPNGQVGVPYYFQLTATGDQPITWQVINMTELPPGTHFNITTGEIYGTPMSDGKFTIDVKAVNSAGNDTVTLNILIDKSADGNYFNGKLVQGAYFYFSEDHKLYRVDGGYMNGIRAI